MLLLVVITAQEVERSQGFHLLVQTKRRSQPCSGKQQRTIALHTTSMHVAGPERSCPMMHKPHTDRALRGPEDPEKLKHR